MRCRRALFGLHAKPSFRFLWCDQFPVVAEDHFWRIPRFQRYPRRVVKDREPIGDIRVAQSVRFPLESVAESRNSHLRTLMQTNGTARFGVRLEPELKISRDRHEPPLTSLGFVRRDGDESVIKVNFAPVEAL